jgi:two-component system CitB family response regulator
MKKKLLIVETDQSVVQVYVAALAHYFEIQIAETGEQALEILSVFKPDVALVSVVLYGSPAGLQGMDLLGLIKAKMPRTIVLMSSAAREIETELMELGADLLIKKPFSKEELLRALRSKGVLPLQ